MGVLGKLFKKKEIDAEAKQVLPSDTALLDELDIYTNKLMRLEEPFDAFNARRTKDGSMITEISVSIAGIIVKFDQIKKLLRESFNENDLTYVTYINTLESVLKLALDNAKGVAKRIDNFDYVNGWYYEETQTERPSITGVTTSIVEKKPKSSNGIYEKYVEQIRERTLNIRRIESKLDALTYELVNLDEVSEAPLDDLKRLIDTTGHYKEE